MLNYFIFLTIFLPFFSPWLLQRFSTPIPKFWLKEEVVSSFIHSRPPVYAGQEIQLPQNIFFLTEILRWDFFIIILIVGVAVFFGSRYRQGLRELDDILHDTFTVKHVGRIAIGIHDNIRGPCSFLRKGQHWVLLPSRILEKPQTLSIAVSHELQHIRQHDTHLMHIIQWAKIFCGWNPFFMGLTALVNQFQEFSCDEQVLRRKNVDSSTYGQVLISVLDSPSTRTTLTCAHSMARVEGLKLLKWRLSVMVKPKRFKSKMMMSGILLVTVVTGASFATAASSVFSNGEVTLHGARDLAAQLSKSATLPIFVDEFVVNKLNKYLVSPEGRSFMKKSIARMNNFKPMIAKELQKRHLPEELMVVPLVESGYQNFPPHVNPVGAAGIWQIMPETGRRFGLKVDTSEDERLHLSRSTHAALDYLEILYKEFGDWHLALAAYNKGEHGLRTVMSEAGTSNPTVLHREKKINDYLSTTMAMIMILKKPDLLF